VSNIADTMRELLVPLQPLALEIRDDSALHAGHAGAQDGGHYRLRIISTAFVGQPVLKRHRMVYDALAPLMRRDIHALSLSALTPEESQISFDKET
jgi:BolA protein